MVCRQSLSIIHMDFFGLILLPLAVGTMRLTKLAMIGLLLGLSSPALAQSGCGGQFGALRFCGSIAGGLPGPVLIPPGGTTPINPGTVLGNPGAGPGTSLPVATSTPILGVAGSVVGTLGFRNLTTGSITLQPATGALGSSVLTMPAITDTLAGFALANGGTNNSLVASNGGIVWSDASKLNILAGTATARQMLQSGASTTPAWSTSTWPATTTINRLLFSSAANTVGEVSTVNGGMLNANSSGVPSMTVTPVLGVPASSQGTLGFAGVTGGTATVTAQATAGSPTITLPNTSGTLADGASSPLVLSATTGNLTCPTCTTSAASLTANQLVIGSGSQGEQSLGALGTTTTVLHGNAGGAPTFGSVVSADMNITTTTCTNQFVTAISAGGVGTCTTDTLASAQHANQGTTTTVLHGNAAGNPSFSAVSLSADISGFGTGVATALGASLSANGGVTSTIASGSTALGTGAISSGTCVAAVTATATNTATTDVVMASFNSDP